MKRRRPIVAIDGPVGAGKSTVARELARELGFTYVNTGAMYRAVALAARSRGIDPAAASATERLEQMLATLRLEVDGPRLMLDGRDVTGELGEPALGDLASRLSTLGVVRARMRELQRAAGANGGVVMEGRDIGTAIFSDAEFKFYLDADPRERAARRARELAANGVKCTVEEALEALLERDRRDRERALAPLRQAADAQAIDSTGLTIEQVVARLSAVVKGR